MKLNTVTVTIGWTRHHDNACEGCKLGYRVDHAHTCGIPQDYWPFNDAWAPGQPQHIETIEVELPDVTELAVEITEASLAESVFVATNAPEVEEGTIAGRILAAIQATGYRGEGAHWSLSVGDTVTVNGAIWSCEKAGWAKLGQVSPHQQDAILREQSLLAEARNIARVTGSVEGTATRERRTESGELVTEGTATWTGGRA